MFASRFELLNKCKFLTLASNNKFAQFLHLTNIPPSLLCCFYHFFLHHEFNSVSPWLVVSDQRSFEAYKACFPQQIVPFLLIFFFHFYCSFLLKLKPLIFFPIFPVGIHSRSPLSTTVLQQAKQQICEHKKKHFEEEKHNEHTTEMSHFDI